jgi:hypothetical protein
MAIHSEGRIIYIELKVSRATGKKINIPQIIYHETFYGKNVQNVLFEQGGYAAVAAGDHA